MALEALQRDLARRRQYGERDRQVEPRSFLPELCRRQVDRDPAQRPLELGRGDPAAHPLFRLLAGAVGEPDDRERGHPALEVRLHLDAASLEPDQSMRNGPCEHVLDASRVGVTGLSRNRAGRVNPRGSIESGALNQGVPTGCGPAGAPDWAPPPRAVSIFSSN